MDTNHIHIHLAIDTISWVDGRRFDFGFEAKWLRSLIRGWENSRNKMLTNDPAAWERRWDYYGYK